MRKFLVIALLSGLWLINANLFAQQIPLQQRAQELATSFNKSKHGVKEKHGVRVEKFKEVRNELVVKADAREYSGIYEASFGLECSIKIMVGADGKIEVAGSEPGGSSIRRFTLRDAKIVGGLLTGTKVYEDGSTENFEGVFINRTERDSPTATGNTSFGLGVVYDPPKTNDNGFSMSRLFYEKQR